MSRKVYMADIIVRTFECVNEMAQYLADMLLDYALLSHTTVCSVYTPTCGGTRGEIIHTLILKKL